MANYLTRNSFRDWKSPTRQESAVSTTYFTKLAFNQDLKTLPDTSCSFCSGKKNQSAI